MGSVIYEKGLIHITGAKVAPQHRQDSVLRLNLTAQNTSQLGKADKTFQKVRFAVQMPDSGNDRKQSFIGKIPQESWSIAQQLDD